MTRLVNALYPLPDYRRTPVSLLSWWESRRLLYNGVVGATGLVTLAGVAFFTALPGGPGGVDLWELVIPIVAYGLLANLCYSLGWMIEMVARWLWGTDAPDLGPFLFREGLFFSVGVTLLPLGLTALMWMMRLVMMLVG
jgi:hypothetical protein